MLRNSAKLDTPSEMISRLLPFLFIGLFVSCSLAEELQDGEKPPMTHVVLTGRNAKDKLIEAADLVTEMELVKHPFRSGVKAQQGVEF